MKKLLLLAPLLFSLSCDADVIRHNTYDIKIILSGNCRFLSLNKHIIASSSTLNHVFTDRIHTDTNDSTSVTYPLIKLIDDTSIINFVIFLNDKKLSCGMLTKPYDTFNIYIPLLPN